MFPSTTFLIIYSMQMKQNQEPQCQGTFKNVFLSVVLAPSLFQYTKFSTSLKAEKLFQLFVEVP